MGPTLSKKEITTQIKDLRAKVGDSKDAIKGEFRHFRKVSKVFVKATGEYKKAKAAYDKKPKAKQERKLDAALEKFYMANDDYKEVYKVIDANFTTVEQCYSEICDLLEMRGARRKMEKTTLEFEKYREWLEHKLAALSENVPELIEDEEEAPAVEEEPVVEEAPAVEEEPVVEEASVVEEAPAPAPAPVAAPVSTPITVAPVSINPVILDVSSIVNNAVENTIAKFSLHMDKKLRDYFDTLVLPQPAGVAATTVVKEVVKEVVAPAATEQTAVSDESVELQGEVLTKQQEIYSKLKAMSEEVTAMLEALEAISGKQKDLNGMQKQTNDTLRRIMRDQQGIQVSLRVVTQDQAEVNAQQATVAENQKLVLEQQQALAEAQSGMINTQNEVANTQSGLNDAMKAVMQAQKEILNTQNRIAQGNAKAQEAGKVLLEKQAELTELQKAALANQRQATKDFKDAEAKPASRQRKPKAEAPVEEAPAVEAPAEEAPAEAVTE